MTTTVQPSRVDVAAPPTQRAERTLERAALLSILVLAAVVRLWGLGAQPILYFDSGVYLGEGAFLASAAQKAAVALVSSEPANPFERVARAVETGTDGHPPDIAKPGHAVLVALAFLVLGKGALAAGLVSALAGIGTVAATYAIGMRGWGPRVALPAAALLAVSGQHLVYSREPLVEADGLLFATLASLVYLRARGARGLLAAGLLWGLAFSCNNRLSYLPAVFLIAELARWPGLTAFLRRGVTIGVGFLAPLGIIEAAYLAAKSIARASGTPANWLDYGQQLAAFTRMNPPDRVRFDEWPTYFADVALMDGLPVLALLVIGIGLIMWRMREPSRTRPQLLLAGSLLVPLALYSVYSTGEVRLRHFSLALPWVMLAAALALQSLASLFRQRERIALTVGVGVLIIAALPRVVALDAAPNGMSAVLDFIGNQPVASTNGPVTSFYVGEDRTNARLREAFINVPADLDALGQHYSTLLVDMQAEVFAGDLTDRYARATPRLVVANGSDAWYLADLLEHYGMAWGGWNDVLAKWRANRADASLLRVYVLADVLR